MNPRPLKELLQILLYKVEQNYEMFGLCNLYRDLFFQGTITSKEYKCLSDYFRLESNKRGLVVGYQYFFPKGESQPRIEFLKQEISKL